MGLFSSSTSKSTTTNKDNSVAIEGDNENVFLSPESSYSPTWYGDVQYGLNSLQVGTLVEGVLDKQGEQTKSLVDLNKQLTAANQDQVNKLVGVVEGLKTDGTAWLKWLPFALIAAFLVYSKVKK